MIHFALAVPAVIVLPKLIVLLGAIDSQALPDDTSDGMILNVIIIIH